MPVKRLVRSRADRMIGGVCGGFADYFDIDPVLTRLGTVALTVAAPPVGVIAYIVCCIVMPEVPGAASSGGASGASGPPPAEPPSGSARGDAHTGQSGASNPTDATGHAPPLEERPVSAPAAHDTNPGLVGGVILIGIGLLFLMINLDVFDWWYFRYMRWRYLWPVVVMIVGLWMIGRAALPDGSDRGRRRRERRRHAD